MEAKKRGTGGKETKGSRGGAREKDTSKYRSLVYPISLAVDINVESSSLPTPKRLQIGHATAHIHIQVAF